MFKLAGERTGKKSVFNVFFEIKTMHDTTFKCDEDFFMMFQNILNDAC